MIRVSQQGLVAQPFKIRDEPEFIEALELLVDDINANKEINMFGIIAFMHQLHNRMNVREKIYKFAANKDMPDPAAPIIFFV